MRAAEACLGWDRGGGAQSHVKDIYFRDINRVMAASKSGVRAPDDWGQNETCMAAPFLWLYFWLAWSHLGRMAMTRRVRPLPVVMPRQGRARCGAVTL